MLTSLDSQNSCGRRSFPWLTLGPVGAERGGDGHACARQTETGALLCGAGDEGRREEWPQTGLQTLFNAREKGPAGAAGRLVTC